MLLLQKHCWYASLSLFWKVTEVLKSLFHFTLFNLSLYLCLTSFILPRQHHFLAFLLVDPFVYVCVCMCACAWVHIAAWPLLPGLIIVLRRKLPFSVCYPWQRILPCRAACLWSSGAPSIPLPLSPTLLSPHYSPPPFFLCLQPTSPLLFPASDFVSLFYFSHTAYSLWIFSTDLLFCELSLHVSHGSLHVSNE